VRLGSRPPAHLPVRGNHQPGGKPPAAV